ncbi:F0F1 ATP synthase subunit A [Macellibacteroides fermentans]|uniref:F0F1 ATP synthase subunit A n=1 Tax=Macellibacteroides fermentans TaxID=879969 RepID=UPI00406CA9B3
MKQAGYTIRKTVLMLFLLLAGIAKGTSQEVNVGEIVFSHIKDSYEWHITKWNNTDIAVPLPVIVRSAERGWFVFMSSKISHGHSYNGFRVATNGENQGKLVEINAAGSEVRPLDLSLTKNASALLFSSSLLLFLILRVARFYKRNPLQTPGGWKGMIEVMVLYIRDGVIKENVGEDYEKYSSYLLTIFFFILLNNLMGLIPIFPFGANVTGNIAITFLLALCTFMIVNVSGTKAYWKEIVWPDTPLFLKLPVPIMPFVNAFEVFTKPFSLMIRLFANIMAGHTIILGLTCLIFVTVSMGAAVNSGMTVLSVILTVFMNFIELLVACIQAYIFTMLSAVYIGQAKAGH